MKRNTPTAAWYTLLLLILLVWSKRSTMMPTGNKNLTRCKLCRSLLKVVSLNTSELPPSVAASLRLIPARRVLRFRICTLQFYHSPAKESKHQFLYLSDQLLLWGSSAAMRAEFPAFIDRTGFICEIGKSFCSSLKVLRSGPDHRQEC